MNKNVLIGISLLLGLIFFLASAVYFIEPAKSLPSFMPGYDSHLARHHFTHAVGTLILGLLCFVFAWFQSGKKGNQPTEKKE